MFRAPLSLSAFRRHVVVVVCALLLSSVAVPVAGAATAPLELSAQTTIVAHQSGSARVFLPRAATIDLNVSEDDRNLVDVTFNDQPTLAGFVITPDTPSPGMYFAATRLPEDPERKIRVGYTFDANRGCSFSCTLPAGTYRVYVITEPKATNDPVIVDLSLHGLDDGVTHVLPMNPVAHEIKSDADLEADAMQATPATDIGARGMGVDLDVASSSGIVFTAFWWRGATQSNTAGLPYANLGTSNLCRYSGAPNPLAFYPGCPGGEEFGQRNLVTFLDIGYEILKTASSTNRPAGRYQYGGYAANTGITNMGVAGFWADLN